MDQEKFDGVLETFVIGCQTIHTTHMERNFPRTTPDTISATRGKRYARIVRKNGGSPNGSVHCFVDMTNGDVLKAASWKAPAKHARGNIFDEHNGLGLMNEYGPVYLR